jgi:DNA-binding transcriptional ArsR family regulator
MEEKEVLLALAALAQPARLRVYRALVAAGLPGLTPGALAATLTLASATLSFHLKELATARLVDMEQVSRHRIYRANYPRMHALLAYLTENCCQGVACPEAECAPGAAPCAAAPAGAPAP